jgi:hypothetical protein
MDLGKLGVWTTYRAIGEENAGAAAALARSSAAVRQRALP